MPLTKEDLRNFTQFADAKLSEGAADSLLELAGEWESQRREMEDTVADIRQSHCDIEAGRVNTVADTFAGVRKQLGLP